MPDHFDGKPRNRTRPAAACGAAAPGTGDFELDVALRRECTEGCKGCAAATRFTDFLQDDRQLRVRSGAEPPWPAPKPR